MNHDNPNDDFSRAPLLDSTNLSSLKKGDVVRVTGVISESNPKLLDNYILATKEIKIKQRDRSVWETSESFIGPLIIKSSGLPDITVKISEKFIPCGDTVRVVLPEKNAKNRVLGVEAGSPITGYGKLEEINPPIVNLGSSPCMESLDSYTKNLQKKFPSYILAALFLAIPSLFLIYLGLQLL